MIPTKKTFPNGGIVVILMWIYRLVIVCCVKISYILYIVTENVADLVHHLLLGEGGGGVNDSFSVHAPVELHDIVLLQFQRIHSQLSYHRNIM